jgi:uncharacterized protein YkwD
MKLGRLISLLGTVAILSSSATAFFNEDKRATPDTAAVAFAIKGPVKPVNELIQQVLDLTNAERKKANLKPLVLDETLNQAAMFKATDLASAGFFDHKDSAGRAPKDRIEMFGYKDWARVSENIAGGYLSAEEVVDAWMKSPSHRVNILDAKVEEIGLGFYFDANSKHGWYWVQNFARRMK